MKGSLKTLLVVCSLVLSSMVVAAPITIVSQADTWDYNFGTSLGGGGAASATFTTFTNGYTGTSNGQAAFGNTNVTGAPYNTFWAANNALYMQKTVNLTGNLTGITTLNVAVDNGAAIWVNGNLAFQASAGGFTSIWEYSTGVSNAFFVNGLNTISVLANDYGGATYFDMELSGDLVSSTSVPEPSILVLLGIGLLGFGLTRRRKLTS